MSNTDLDPLLDDETEIMVGDRVCRLRIWKIGGTWFITSRRIKGLWVAHRWWVVAMRAARIQIARLQENGQA